ncbi:hypothetical protein L7F22_043059 [Adiantum nelumboides]|nr:hypothetical protein [Adiantum nelumboides]
MEAAARESRANAREDMAVLTSGAREKVDNAMASMQALGQKVLHPMDKTKKAEADAAAEQKKKEAREKGEGIRSIAAQQAATERVAARSMVAKGVAEAGGTRYPVLMTDQPTPPQQALGDLNYAANQPQPVPQVMQSDYHPSHPLVPREPLHDQSAVDSHSHSESPTPLEAIRVGRPQDQRSMVGGADTSTQVPAPVAPPSRHNQSGEQDREGEKVEEGIEDADYYYPPTRIVQT